MPSEGDHLQSEFLQRYPQEDRLLQDLLRGGVSRGERERIHCLLRIKYEGLTKVFATRKSEAGRAEVLSLVREFIRYGAKSVLLPGPQRGGDFLNNQLRGQWAERVVRSMDVRDLTFVPFGPSGAAMPGEEDHREVVMTFRQIVLLEGKRPDLLGFRREVWQGLSESARQLAATWPRRTLDDDDRRIIGQARCGVEVKNSTWHYATRRAAGRWELSVTVKEEELSDLTKWTRDTGVPLIFAQVLFDELYCMSFRRMMEAKERGYIYNVGDYTVDKETGADRKIYHKFHLNDLAHRCGMVEFPEDSRAELRVLKDGGVIPFIVYEPARAFEADSDLIHREIDYRP